MQSIVHSLPIGVQYPDGFGKVVVQRGRFVSNRDMESPVDNLQFGVCCLYKPEPEIDESSAGVL